MKSEEFKAILERVNLKEQTSEFYSRAIAQAFGVVRDYYNKHKEEYMREDDVKQLLNLLDVDNYGYKIVATIVHDVCMPGLEDRELGKPPKQGTTKPAVTSKLLAHRFDKGIGINFEEKKPKQKDDDYSLG